MVRRSQPLRQTAGHDGRFPGWPPAPPLRMVAVSLDCADPGELARFYLTLLGGETLWSSPRSTGIRVPGGGVLVPQRVEGYQPPEWPGSPLVHLDLTGGLAGPGLDGAVARAIAAGAKEADIPARPAVPRAARSGRRTRSASPPWSRPAWLTDGLGPSGWPSPR